MIDTEGNIIWRGHPSSINLEQKINEQLQVIDIKNKVKNENTSAEIKLTIDYSNNAQKQNILCDKKH